MKNTKRILIVLLACALLVSGLLVGVSAEEAVTPADIEKTLEFFAYKDYVADDFEADGANGTYFADSGSKATIVADPKDENNSVLFVKNPQGTTAPSYTVTDDMKQMVLSFSLSLETVSASKGNFSILAKPVDADGKSLLQTTLLQFATVSGVTTVKYSVWNAETSSFTLTSLETESLAITSGEWYDVQLFLNTETSEYSFKISADGGENWFESEKLSLGKIATLTELKIECKRTGTKNYNYYLDDVKIYAGTFIRNSADKIPATNKALLDLDALYNSESTDSATRVRLAEYLRTLIGTYEYTSDVPEVKAVIDKAPSYINAAFANEFISRVSSISAEDTYYTRLEKLAGIDYFDKALPENELIDTAPGLENIVEAVKAARAAYNLEIEACATVKQKSEEFLTLMATEYQADSKDYDGFLKSFYEKATAITGYDATYAEPVEGIELTMTEAVELYEQFCTKYERLDASADVFINAINTIKGSSSGLETSQPGEEEYETAWGNLYSGYFVADEIYNNGEIDVDLDNDTHAALKEAITYFNEKSAAIETDVQACEAFLAKMKETAAATYYAATLAALAEAKELISGARDMYPGVNDAKNLYNELINATANAESASAAYITAVAAIEGKTSFAEKKAAVEAALALKTSGDVLGIEGVSDANIKLSIAAAEIDALIGNSKALIAYVEAFKSAATLSERRTILVNAIAARDKSEATYEGVAEAKAELESQIEAFEGEIKAVNDAHANAVAGAVDTVGAFANDAKVYKAASIIKDFVK